LWNNYPRHEFEYVREVPTFDREYVETPYDEVTEGRKRYNRDPLSAMFKLREKGNK